MNPEFTRNLWLELSPARLLLMPCVLALLGALCLVLGGPDKMAVLLRLVFGLLGAALLLGWGSFAVLASINTEVRERTWDQQRLSALTPWQMAWGKLLGAAVYPWYGGLLCALVVAATAFWHQHPGSVLVWLLAGLLGALALHAWLLAARMHTLDQNTEKSNAATTRLFALLLLLQVLPVPLLFWLSRDGSDSQVATGWWGLGLPPDALGLTLASLLLLLGLLALWRSMSAQLMVRTLPWAWLLGCVALALVAAGFQRPGGMAGWIAAVLMAVAVAATYFALFTQKNNLLVWRAVLYHARHSGWQRTLQALPLWPVSWLLAALAAVAYSLTRGALADPAYTLPLTSMAWLALLHVLRDAGIYLFFAWRNSPRSPAGLALLTYVVLGMLLPMLVGGGALVTWFEPLYGLRQWLGADATFGTTAWLAMGLHLLVVAALLAWRWRGTPAPA